MRRTDGSYIIRSKDSPNGKVQAKKFKMNAEEGERVLIERYVLHFQSRAQSLLLCGLLYVLALPIRSRCR
jgi:hypothetical protein